VLLATACSVALLLGASPGSLVPTAAANEEQVDTPFPDQPVAAPGGDAALAADQSAATLPASVYWGAYVDGWPSKTAALDDFETKAGKRMSIVAWGASWWRDHKYVPFQTNYFDAVRNRGSIPMLSWTSWDYCCGLEQPQSQLGSIIRGEHDVFLRSWARAAHAWGHPLFLNFDSEMNGWWWPWSEQINSNSPGEFVSAWRHVVNIFREEGATNVTWLWCVNIEAPETTPIAQLYPGDDYVDWTCMDAYNFGIDNGFLWQDPAQVFGASPNLRRGFNTYEALTQLAPNKPVMVAETGSSERGGSKAAWITDAFTDVLPNQFPQIRGVVWFAWPDPAFIFSWAIDSSPEALAAFRNSIALPRYASNSYRNLEGRPIAPPDGPFFADDGAADQADN